MARERNPLPSVHLRDDVREAARQVLHLDGNELLQITDEGFAGQNSLGLAAQPGAGSEGWLADQVCGAAACAAGQRRHR